MKNPAHQAVTLLTRISAHTRAAFDVLKSMSVKERLNELTKVKHTLRELVGALKKEKLSDVAHLIHALMSLSKFKERQRVSLIMYIHTMINYKKAPASYFL